tara:strand:- start:137 stop:1480 length:1344 start_codon:yes stop_codon:yes gene_type:complete
MEEIKILYKELEEKITHIPAEIINIEEIRKQLSSLEEASDKAKISNEEMLLEIKDRKDLFVKLENFIDNFDKEAFKSKIDMGDSYQKQIDEVLSQIQVSEMKHDNHKKKINILNQVPCGDKFPECHFIKDAHTAKNNISDITISLDALKISKKEIDKSLQDLQLEKANEYLDKFDKVYQKKLDVQQYINRINLKIEKNKTSMLRLKTKKAELLVEKEKYEDNKDVIENLEALMLEKQALQDSANKAKDRYNECHDEVMQLYKEIGSLEQKLAQTNKDYEEYLDLQDEYAAYDLFMLCMHSNGISYDVVKKRLPLINEEISKILTNIVDFEIMFENEEKKLDILIKHPKHDPRPIEMGSGAEKTIASMALRLALLNVSTLPKSDMFILDEPGTALDEENMEGFTRILDMTKTQFKTVVLISHLDSLKDSSDLQIIIDKDDEGYAHVEY